MAAHLNDESIEWTRDQWQRLGGPKPDHFAAMAAVMRTAAVVAREVDLALKGYELNRRGYLILVALQVSEDGAKSLGQLSKSLLVHPTTATIAVDQLETAGLVRRMQHPSDKRAVLTCLTDEGRQRCDEASAGLAKMDFGLNGITAGAAESLASQLRQVRVGLGDLG